MDTKDDVAKSDLTLAVDYAPEIRLAWGPWLHIWQSLGPVNRFTDAAEKERNFRLYSASGNPIVFIMEPR
jgi:hypothetical protein